MTAARTPAGAARRLVALPGRAIGAVLLVLLAGYRRFVSPLLGPRCRYYPSCSSYAEQAVRVHGAGKGTLLALARVGRCHPWTPGGVDHVPPRGRWRTEPAAEPAAGSTTRPTRPVVPSCAPTPSPTPAPTLDHLPAPERVP